MSDMISFRFRRFSNRTLSLRISESGKATLPFFKVDSSTSVSDSKELSGFCTLTSGNAILFLLNFGRIRFRRGDVVLAVFSYENSVVGVSGIVVDVVIVVVVVVVVVLVVVITGLLVEVECGYALMKGLLFSATVEDCCGVDLSISAAGVNFINIKRAHFRTKVTFWQLF
jgi:hypothetical protein